MKLRIFTVPFLMALLITTASAQYTHRFSFEPTGSSTYY